MADSLLTYDQALELARSAVKPLGRKIRLPLEGAVGYAVAEAVVATEPNPRFDNSAVDGYAVGNEDDARKGTMLDLVRSVHAGEPSGGPIPFGRAVRVLTGAPVPPNAYGVAMQEDVALRENFVTLTKGVAAGAHIRREGEEFKAGAWLANVGQVLNPGAIALLASQGMVSAQVYDRPRVAVVATGDEVVPGGRDLKPHQIRDTNSLMLHALSSGACARDVTRTLVPDSRQALADVLGRLSLETDLIIVAGGASVGDRDFVPQVVSEMGEICFHGVAMRPGKPILFGRIGHVPAFGLPGNPSSAFVAFELFVRDTIRRLAGWERPEPLWVDLPFAEDREAYAREDFVRASIVDGVAVPASNQGSYALRPLMECDCLVRIPAGVDGSGVTPRKALLMQR